MDDKNLFYAFLTIFVLLGVLLSINFVFAAEPVVTMHSPTNNTWNTTNTNIAFDYTCGSNATGGEIWFNVTLWLNGAPNVSISNASGIIQNDTHNNLTIPLLEDGIHLWFIECLNGTTQANGGMGWYRGVNSSDVRTIKIDTVTPIGELTMPRTTNIHAQNLIQIKCGGADNRSGIKNVAIKITEPGGTEKSYTLENDEPLRLRGIKTGKPGKYLVDCIIYDNAGTSVSTEQEKFSVYYRTRSAAAPEEEEPEEEVTPVGEEVTPEEGVPEVKAPSSKAWIWIVVIVVIILILYFVLKKKK